MSGRLQEILARMSAGLPGLRRLIPEVLANPRAYPKDAMLLAIIAALMLLLFLTVGLVLWDWGRHFVRTRRTGVRVRRRWTNSMLLVPAGIVFALLVAAVVVPSIAVTSGACGWCHATESATMAWRGGDHQTVACYGCHAEPGILGGLQASVSGASFRLGGRTANGPLVGSLGCLECHSDVMRGVVGDQVRVRHADLVTAGLQCTVCHPEVGHEGAERAEPVILRTAQSRCLVCHDDRGAPAACSTCHPSRPSDTASAPSGSPNHVPVSCGIECHGRQRAAECIECHGLVLPHPANFLSTHAPMSQADPQLCAKCHEAASETLACACHPDGSGHGSYSTWYPRHGAQALTTGPSGCRCHDDNAFASCRLCHPSSPW